ncbi:hypothetical protein SO802_029775 [Lithocarpus litseifolius]|uniref:Uncharacterized protein n=1 Tax=Lithocarpus litseifolius TaxID=425828 RepID=A0AAW2BU78_9ROSI
MGWDYVTITVTGSDEAWAQATVANLKCKEFRKKRLDHYNLLGQLFNAGTATGFLQISFTQLAPNSDEEQELDAAFLTHIVHVNVKPDSGDDVEELPTPVVGQGSKRARKQPSHSKTSAGKKKKGRLIEYMTDAIIEFTDMSRKRRSDKESDSRKETVESAPVGDRFSMDRAVTILNCVENVYNYTMFKVLNELYKPDCRAAFIMLRPDKRKGWMDLVS